MNLKENSLDPDQMAGMCQLTWIYTVCHAIKVYLWSKGLRPSLELEKHRLKIKKMSLETSIKSQASDWLKW
jgi:hypothetical protein